MGVPIGKNRLHGVVRNDRMSPSFLRFVLRGFVKRKHQQLQQTKVPVPISLYRQHTSCGAVLDPFATAMATAVSGQFARAGI